MSYYRLLHLQCEPFSTSPDPRFFYLSPVHRAALYRIRIGIELRRGLSVVGGDIGTGKSTMARKLSQILYQDPRMDFHAILNPMDHHDDHFLRTLLQTFGISPDRVGPNPMDCLKAIEKYLFQKGMKERKTVVLLIDEAQLLSPQSFEVLRALLNYETNTYKLLQLVLTGQLELIAKIWNIQNLWDRISLKLLLSPLEEAEARELIQYRIRQAGYGGHYPLFDEGALHMIYEKTGGYPRRISILCHDALEYLVMMDKPQVTEEVIQAVSRCGEGWAHFSGVNRESSSMASQAVTAAAETQGASR